MAKTLTLIFNLALLFGMSQTISGPLIPVFVKEFSIRYDRIGFIFFIGLFFGMLAATIFGRLSDRLGRKLVINLGIGLLASGILGVIFSFYAISFAISYCLMNLGFGSLEAGITTGAAELGETNLSFVLTGFSKFSSLGAFLGPLILFTILYFTQYWRIIFILIFIALIVILGIFLKIKYPKKEYHEGHNISLKSKDIINPVILTGAAVLFFHNGVIILFGAWLTTYFSTFEIKLESSILIVSFFWLSVLLGATSAQRIIKKIEEKKYLIIIALISPLVLS
ncbi:MAG: MFS transporter, partial [Actinobacteria bacterium]|nr:MFS transporter [Actinomycetota bacterium]